MHLLMDIRLELRAGISESAMVKVATATLEDVTSRSFIQKYAVEKRRRYYENSSNI